MKNKVKIRKELHAKQALQKTRESLNYSRVDITLQNVLKKISFRADLGFYTCEVQLHKNSILDEKVYQNLKRLGYILTELELGKVTIVSW